MKNKTNTSSKKIVLALLVTAILAVLPASHCFAAGLLKPVDSGDENDVYMKSHHVNVTINNGFARTEVDQVFANDSDSDLRAIYSFPVPKQASLSELSMWIDGNEVIGEVIEKERAKKIHQEQMQKGNDTALAEKDEYRTFEVSVYPVRAGGETRIRLVYYQPIEIDLNIGRYVYPMAEGGVDEERITFWSVDDKVHESFKFDLTLKSAFPVSDIRVPSHLSKAIIQQTESGEEESLNGENYHVNITSENGDSLARDIVVYYKLDDSVPGRIELIPYREGLSEDGTFMVVVTPAADLQRISEGVDFTFVLDVSGSMKGGKIATLVDGVSRVIGKMNSEDRFRIITFNNSATDFTNGYISATPSNVEDVLRKVKNITSGGGTNLFAGIKMAYNMLDDDRTTGVILVTDGVANVGQTQQKHFLDLLRQYDIRLFTFVIGNSANQPLLERLALDSGGFAMNISDSDDIVGKIIQAKSKILFENLHDVELKFHGEKVKKLTPTKIGNLYQGQQLVMFGRYHGTGEIEIELKAKISGQEHSWKCKAELPEVDTDNPELERLWALSAIEDVMKEIRENGENNGLRKKVIELGTEYSLVTNYTSMLVISEMEMENEQIQRKNADRVNKERKAQQKRSTQPVKNYRVDQNKQNPSGNKGAFDGKRSPGIGSGPVGPAFIAMALWLRKKKSKRQ